MRRIGCLTILGGKQFFITGCTEPSGPGDSDGPRGPGRDA